MNKSPFRPSTSRESIPTIAYERVSASERQTGGLSLPWQDETIARSCLARSWPEPLRFVDDGVSASRPLEKRPAGRQMLEAIDGKPCRIVVAKLDRIFRSNLHFSQSIAEWQAAGIQLVSVVEGFDMGTVFGRFQAQIMTAFSELERGVISERTRASFAYKKAHGIRATKDALYGEKFVASGQLKPNGKPIYLVEPCAEEIKVIETIVAWHRAGDSLRKIAAKLTVAGVPTRRGGEWTAPAVLKILRRWKASHPRGRPRGKPQDDKESGEDDEESQNPASEKPGQE